jgi:hypothetical protein
LQHTPGGDEATTTTPENASMPARPESGFQLF